MPVGMTLQQLYSQSTYNDQGSTAGPVSGSSTSATTSSSTATSTTPTSTSATANKRKGTTAKSAKIQPSDHESHSPRSVNAANDEGAFPQGQENQHPGQHNQQMPTSHLPSYLPRGQYGDHSHAPMSQQFPPLNQLPPPTAFTSQYKQPGNNGSEEYGMADPFPFEYMGMRKYQDAGKDASSDHRYSAPGVQYQDNYGAHSPHPSVYDNQQHVHPTKNVEDHSRGTYHQGYGHHGGIADRYGASELSYPASHHPMSSAHLYGAPLHSMAAPHQSFPTLVDSKKDGALVVQPPSTSSSSSYSGHSSVVEYGAAPTGPQGASQEAVIKVKTPLKAKYWRNGRRNLQCFPSCKVFGDYSSIKIEDLKQHDFMWGKCRGSIITEVTLNSSVAFDDILLLGRVHSLENIPVAFEEAVIRECMLGRMVEPDVMDAMKDQWMTGERLPDFVQQDANTACFEFKPKVWKYNEDMAQGKCKRRNVKYYVQFEAFVLVMSGERRYYACIGSGMSTAFEVGSSRVLARQKRKAATGGNDVSSQDGKVGGPPGPDLNGQAMHHPMMQPPSAHGMMPHGMSSQMFPSSYPLQGYPRGLAPAFPHPPIMSHMHHGHYAMQQHQQPPLQHHLPQPGLGDKRKLTNEMPALQSERATKMLKSMSSAGAANPATM